MNISIGFLIPDENDKIGKTITYFGRTPAVTSHCFFIVDNDVYEALIAEGVVKRDFNMAYKNKTYEIYDITLEALSGDGRVKLKEFLESYIGSFKGWYGLVKLPFQAIDGIFSKILKRPVFFASKIFPGKWFPYCSSLVGYGLHKTAERVVLDILINWRAYSPDDLRDILIMCPNLFPFNKKKSTICLQRTSSDCVISAGK